MRLMIKLTGILCAFPEQSAAKTLRVIASNGREAIISAHASSISGLLRSPERDLRNSVLLARCAECLRTALNAPEFWDFNRRIAA